MFAYLDNSATTKPYEQVIEEMNRVNALWYGNPSSLHRMGIDAEKIVKTAKRSLAEALCGKPEEILFTGGGTESDNLALFGAATAGKRKGNRIVTTKIEHPAVLETCRRLQKNGFELIELPVDQFGVVSLEALEDAINEKTILVSVMHVNNELGTVQPIREISQIIKRKSQALFHCDAVQSFGKLSVKPELDHIDLLSVSAHKVHGPKGVGALYLKKGVRIESMICGGGQEGGLRSGTENTAGIAGFSTAVCLFQAGFEQRVARIERAKNALKEGILTEIGDVRINSPKEGCCPSILNVSFLGCRGEVLLHSLEQRDIFVSTGAACSSKKKGSHVLAAAGLAAPAIEGAIRFSFHEFHTDEEIRYVIDELKKAVESMRRLTRYR